MRKTPLARYCTQVLKHHQGPVLCLCYDVDGDYFLSGGQDRFIYLLKSGGDGVDSKVLQKYEGHGWEVLDVTSSRDHNSFVSGGGDKCLIVWDVMNVRPFRKIYGHLQRINCVALNEEATVAASGSYDATVRLWDLRASTRFPLQILDQAKDSISSLLMTPHQLFAGSVDGHVRQYDMRKGLMISDSLRSPVTSLTLSLNSQALLVSTLDSTIRLFDVATGDLLNEYRGHVNSNLKISSCLSRASADYGAEDEDYVISGSEDGRILFWDFMEASLIYQCQGEHQHAVNALCYHPSKPRLISASVDGTVRVWESESPG